MKEIDIQVSPETAHEPSLLIREVSRHTSIPESDIYNIRIIRRSIDARQRNIKFNLRVQIDTGDGFSEEIIHIPAYPNVQNSKPVIIVGAGPAGLFAALKLMELGLKPVVLERGKDVRARRIDLKAINIQHIVNENSNYCFGEGGAGTYSDGKLYTRSTKRGDIIGILRTLVAFGASHDILVDAHPHIGTNKLPAIIANMRECILAHGGEVHFNTSVNRFILEGTQIKGVGCTNGDVFKSNHVILATGHSARDIFHILQNQKIAIELKPFALGVRIEHPQNLIDRLQYKCAERGPYLPPAPYSIVKQVNGRGVYSFCMCPGGIIAPCATAPGEVVTNGWSPSKRDQATANSGIVVELRPEDFTKWASKQALAALYFQKEVEKNAWMAAGKTQKVPAQRVTDFIQGKTSTNLPVTSYKPGITSTALSEVLPDFVYKALQGGFSAFEASMKGFISDEAIVHAPESRTSSPVRIPRNSQTLEHIHIKGLYPCGEGAGYAGGIISAAMDGEKCAVKCLS